MAGDTNCPYCFVNNEEPIASHTSTPRHQFNVLLHKWENKRERLVKNRHGCEVIITPIAINNTRYNYEERPNKGEHSVQLTPRDLQNLNYEVTLSCKIKNIQSKKCVKFTKANFLHPHPFYSLCDPNKYLETDKVIELEPGGEYEVIVQFKSDKKYLVSNFKMPMHFNFQTNGEREWVFAIVRSLVVNIQEPNQNSEIMANGKSPFTSNDWPKNIKVISPSRLVFLNFYHVPEEYDRVLKFGLTAFKNMTEKEYATFKRLRDVMEEKRATPKNYTLYFHIALWLEEMGQTLGLQQYNMENVSVKAVANMIELEVPGLAEKRPSVLAGDFIDLRISGDHTAYRGVIRVVRDKTILIESVDEVLMDYLVNVPTAQNEIDVRFVLGRLCFERMHKAVDQIEDNGVLAMLFPDISVANNTRPSTLFPEPTFFNDMVYGNVEQKTAVLNILNCTAAMAPYIVFGPPGTGKTVTIVEAILQIKSKTNKTILVCAPANAACDLLTEKLIPHCTKKELYRIMSSSVNANNIHKEVLAYSNYIGEDEFKVLDAKNLIGYRIIVSTLIHIGKFVNFHPDVVFVDEAAQACEPEVDCALAMLKKNNNKQIILAGDPHQLGPSIASKKAEKYGLGISLLERLMDLELYQSRNPNYITKLIRNFRSHPLILHLPNKLFYDNELVPMSASSQNDPLARIAVFKKMQNETHSRLKANLGQPIEFCSVISKERREGRSPSYFNEKEIHMVLKYVQALLALSFGNKEHEVKQEQIGIVTPYIRQVYKVKEILKRNKYTGVEVGTTETFQGREKRVIIITTVRAQEDLLLYDKQYKLGFVKNEKRFNVAVTRAMSKLVVIGCANVLGTDSKWLDFIKLCQKNNAFFGAPFMERNTDLTNEIVNRFNKVNMEDHTKS